MTERQGEGCKTQASLSLWGYSGYEVVRFRGHGYWKVVSCSTPTGEPRRGEVAGGDADLGAEAEFAAVGKLGRGVGWRWRCPVWREIPPAAFFSSSAMMPSVWARAVAVDMVNRLFRAIDNLEREDGVEVFGFPVVLGGRLNAWVQRANRFIATQFTTQRGQFVHQCRDQPQSGAVYQQGLQRAADAGPAHLGIGNDVQGHGAIGRGMNIEMIITIQVGQDRNPRIGLDSRHQALAATRDHQVDPLGGP